MKRLFLDTNILIEYLDNRAGADDAEQIFAYGFSGEVQLYAAMSIIGTWGKPILSGR